MAVIRRYGELPAMFVPDVGEVVLASRSPAGPYLRAVILSARRRASGRIRVDFVWLESANVAAWDTPAVAGAKGNVEIREDDPTPLIRRVPANRR